MSEDLDTAGHTWENGRIVAWSTAPADIVARLAHLGECFGPDDSVPVAVLKNVLAGRPLYEGIAP